MNLAATASMRRSPILKGRIESAALAHGQGIQWVDRNLAALCATDEWTERWATAASANPFSTDLGADPNVITDAMIDTAVGDLIDQQTKDAAATETSEVDDLKQQIADLKAAVSALQAAQATEAPAGS